MPTPGLDIQKWRIRQIVEDFRRGKLVIPEFQRGYVWKPNRAPKLMDSIYRGYPISTLLLWSSLPKASVRRRDGEPLNGSGISWLIDGQQRVITLSRILSGDEGIDVVFNPDKDEFRLANAATQKKGNWFRVCELLDDESYRLIRRALPAGSQGEKIETKFEMLRQIREYEVPAVRMVDRTFDEAVEAFARINTLGVKLRREDIDSARVASRHSGFIADQVGPFVDELRRQGFDRLNVMHLFRACAFIARPDGRRRTPLHELSSAEIHDAWSRTKTATEDAIAVVRAQFGQAGMDIVQSGALLVPVIAICASTARGERDPGGMAGWLAMATLLHRYSRATDTSLDQDLRACRSDDPVGALLTNLRRDAGGLLALPSDFRGTLNDRGALFAAFAACRYRGSTDLFSGAPISSETQVDRYQIFPRAQFSEENRTMADAVANIVFLSAPVSRTIATAPPEASLKKIDPRVLTSQCIPLDRNLWRIDRSEAFFRAREEQLADAFNDFLRSIMPGRRVDAPAFA